MPLHLPKHFLPTHSYGLGRDNAEANLPAVYSYHDHLDAVTYEDALERLARHYQHGAALP